MVQDYFLQRKKALLTKVDKSSIGGWDKRIKKLCDKINKSPFYYTTSSCSGRVVVIIDQEKKAKGLFEFVSHDRVDSDKFWKYLPKEQAKLNLKFKQEPPIIHISCRTFYDANNLLEKARKAGWKKSGILSYSKKDRIIVELNGSCKMEFPLMKKGELLVDDNFLKVVIKRSNENLKKGWGLIKKLEKLI